ncbi:hypothetical protein ACLB2K_068684 [Fragaria x ananassa]
MKRLDRNLGLRSPAARLRSPDAGLRSPAAGLRLPDFPLSLKRLLENLKLQETRDVKEILDLLRKYRIELDELKVMLKMLLEQRRGDVEQLG